MRARAEMKVLLIGSALVSVLGSTSYVCMITWSLSMHSLCRHVFILALPGFVAAAYVSIALFGAHGGGPLVALLMIATPVNFFMNIAIGLALRGITRMVVKRETKATLSGRR
jgi:hypothetical protein